MTSNVLQPILEDSVGPYFPLSFIAPYRNDLSKHEGLVCRPEGQIIRYEGRILDVEGNLVTPALAEFWQADAKGRFRTAVNNADETLDPWFDGFARQYIEDGMYRLTTVKPGPAPYGMQGGGFRAPHITFTLFCDGISKLVTQLFFPDEPLNAQDPLLKSLRPEIAARLIAKQVEVVDGITVFRRDIILRGLEETPFFDDIES